MKPGQSHLIFGIGSTGCATKSGLSKLCYVDAPYKPSENLDAIALAVKHMKPIGPYFFTTKTLFHN